MYSDRSPEEIQQIHHQLVESNFAASTTRHFSSPSSGARKGAAGVWAGRARDRAGASELTGEVKTSSRCLDCDPLTCWVTHYCFFTTEPRVEPPEA